MASNFDKIGLLTNYSGVPAHLHQFIKKTYDIFIIRYYIYIS